MAEIVPAILSDNKKEFKKWLILASQFSKRIQIDIVDGKFAPFLGVLCQPCVKKYSKTNFLEAHIMIENPESQIKFYQKLGFKKIILHYKALINAKKYLANHSRISIALNPDEPVEILKPYFKNIETVLIMGVMPGQMGQKFIPETIDKIRQLRQLSDTIEIEVDGGVNQETIGEIVKTGADIVIAGSAIFGASDPKENFEKLNNRLITKFT